MNQFAEFWSLVYALVLQGFGLVLAGFAAAVFLFVVLRKHYSLRNTLLIGAFFVGMMLFFWFPVGVPQDLQYPFGLKTYGPGAGPALPLQNVFGFFTHLSSFERVADISRDPRDVPDFLKPDADGVIRVTIVSKEVLAEIAPGVTLNYWTFDGTVPGPFLRIREGDIVELTLKNHESSLHKHSIDLHAVTGPGGGAAVTDVMPGESKSFTFKALNPGLFVYHCAHPNVANHMAHGMYGLILVEPEGGLPPVDEELYVMQGEFYTAAPRGTKGLQVIDASKMLSGNPEYIVFNGRVGAMSKDEIQLEQDKTVRIYVGNGGVNLISSFHVIGEIFDTVYAEAQVEGQRAKNVQTTIVPAGGASMVEFKAEVPGTYIAVDHALARLDKGAWGTFLVTGEARPEIFDGVMSENTGH